MEPPIDKMDKPHRKDRDHVLVAAGFERIQNDLWEKDGVVFGRQAALQNALRNRDEGGEGVF